MTTDTFARNISAGPLMTKTKRMTSLQYDIANMKLGRMEFGSSKWIKLATKIVQHLNYSELQDVKLRYGKPWFLTGRSLANKVKRIEGLIKQCPTEEVCAITVVTSIARTKEEALAVVERDGASLDRFIRRRFSDALWVLFPEVDIKLARDVSLDVSADRTWADETPDNQLVYYVHFHGVLRAEGLSRDDIEEGFRRFRNGKRVARFAGSRQVRVQNLRERDGTIDLKQEVKNVFGYGTKRHFRPPTKQRMHEGFAEWMWLTDKIASSARLVRTGGSTGFQHKVCVKAATAEVISTLKSSSHSFTGSLTHTLFNVSLRGIVLNSEQPTIAKTYEKLPLAKIFNRLRSSEQIGANSAIFVSAKPP